MNTVKPSMDTAGAKTASPAEGSNAFSSLLQSLAGGAEESSEGQEALPAQLMNQIEDLLTALQELPVEELTETQQQRMYELVQMIQGIQVPAEQKEKPISLDMEASRKFIAVMPVVEKEAVSKEVQVKLIELVKKLSDILPGVSTADTNKFDAAEAFKGVEGKSITLNAANIEKITAKITEFTESLADGGKKLAAVQPEQVAKLGVIAAAETDKSLKLIGEANTRNADEPETIKAQPAAAVVTAGRSDGGQQQEASQQDDTRQGTVQPAAAADSVKPAAAPSQTTQPRPTPTPVIRMNNLTEELGEVFKNSLRMSTNGESTQIKVNITPDHLGHLDIRLTETNGKIAAQIFTSSLAAKDALDLQLNGLRNTLIQQGLTVEKIEVVQNNSQQSLGQQNAQAEQRFAQQQQRQNAAGREPNGYQQLDEKSAERRSPFESGTMKVDYTV
ncbi:flagellar hook-length control protein FliK [Planococcus sp. CAU13]|uniref:flagellar hook-length control protein FliK n=1 Tax=Planococcus sp. CAU13 TaxID=1541197 RepID=UPI0005300679|nr:flagellar hook-length control protein FliK [Planococcus sp. CAU13]